MKLYEKLYEDENLSMDDMGSLNLFFKIIQEHYLNLIGLNLLFLICCIPIVTIGPALNGLTKVTMSMARDKPVQILRDFFSEFKKNIFKTVGIGLVSTLLLMMLMLSIQFYMGKSVLIFSVFAGILICLLVYSIVVFLYMLNENIYLDLTFRSKFKNALLLVLATPKTTLAIILTVVLPFYLALKSLSLGVPYLLIAYFSVSGVIGSIMSLKEMNKYITKDSR